MSNTLDLVITILGITFFTCAILAIYAAIESHFYAKKYLRAASSVQNSQLSTLNSQLDCNCCGFRVGCCPDHDLGPVCGECKTLLVLIEIDLRKPPYSFTRCALPDRRHHDFSPNKKHHDT